jgi:hypothetical protein
VAAERKPRARRGLILLALVAATTAALPAAASASAHPPHRSDRTLRDWHGKPTDLAGRSQVSRGELIYTDYLYDDYGADLDGTTNATAFRSSAPTSGDYRYPADVSRYGNNAADLRELRLAVDKRGLHGMIALETMLDRDAAVATIAIDTDGRPSGGAGEWPGGADVSTPGADAFVTLSGEGATLTSPGGKTRSIAESIHLRDNAIEFDVPKQLLGGLGGKARVWAGVGLDSGDGTYASQVAGRAALFDLAFQGAETYQGNSSWSDQKQSAALAAGDVSSLGVRLRPRALRQGRSRGFKLVPGFYNRIFRSAHGYGEGIDLRSGGTFGTGSPVFLGRYQPYGLYVPAGFKRGRKSPLLLDLHSLNRNQNQYEATDDGMLEQLGDERRSLIVTPLNRATDGWYLDAGLIDVLEAWDDAGAALEIDRSRTDLMGYSMGGYGTYRLGLLMPDRFARAVTYVGPPVFVYWNYPGPPISFEPEWAVPGNTNRIVGNGFNLPYEINAGGADTLVAISGVEQQAQTFRDLGNEYRFYEHPDASHYTFAIDDVWDHTTDWLGDHRRDRNPVRVRYTRYPSMDLPDGHLTFDGAYWVDGMVVRDDGADDAHGSVDATTEALGGRERRLVDEGSTAIPAGGSGSTAATVTGQHVSPGAKLEARNSFDAKLTNLAAVGFDAKRMGLDTREPIAADIRGDGSVKLTLTGWRGKPPRATLDGEAVAVRRMDGAIRLTLGLSDPDRHLLKLR